MIIRDLGVTDAILDLVDNSVDQKIETSSLDVFQLLAANGTYKQVRNAVVSIGIRSDELSIVDTCGGMSLEEAKTSAFLFGNPNLPGQHRGLSVYGIGMKRAFFKLGRHVSIQSVTKNGFLSMEIDVEAWREKGDTNWDFPIQVTRRRREADGPSGTRIRVRQLHDDTKSRLKSKSYVRDLAKLLGETYALFIKSGVKMRVNDSVVEAQLPVIASYDQEVGFARRTSTIGKVKIFLLAGLTERDDRTPRGWYVFCNGRLVIGPDKSDRTGWGDGLPLFRSKYNHFVGYAYFHSKDPSMLPWTTTKRDVVVESKITTVRLTTQ